ncbi:hypothetical protein EBZ37_12655 [bacterium]|nr:hypothetical protein [bacterium]
MQEIMKVRSVLPLKNARDGEIINRYCFFSRRETIRTDVFKIIQDRIEKEYTPKLQAEAKKLGNPKSADSSQELTPVQKEFRAKLAAAYSRTMRAAQVTESILEHSGIQRHVTPTEKRALREEVKGYFQKSGASQQSESGKALEGHLAQLESQVLSRKTGQSVEQIQREPLEARLAMRKKDFNEGLAAEGVDAEKLPATVRGAIDEVLRKKLTLESRFGLVSERDPETVREIERTDMQLEALLYGIQMGAKHSPITHAAVEEHARRFLGERPEEKLTEVIQALRPGEVKDRREYDSRNAGRAPARSVTPNNGNPARSSSSSAR